MNKTTKKLIAWLLSLAMCATMAPLAFADGEDDPALDTEVTDVTDDPTEAPAEDPTEAPAEDPTEAPAEDPTEAPAEDPTDEPTAEPTETPVQYLTKYYLGSEDGAETFDSYDTTGWTYSVSQDANNYMKVAAPVTYAAAPEIGEALLTDEEGNNIYPTYVDGNAWSILKRNSGYGTATYDWGTTLYKGTVHFNADFINYNLDNGKGTTEASVTDAGRIQFLDMSGNAVLTIAVNTGSKWFAINSNNQSTTSTVSTFSPRMGHKIGYNVDVVFDFDDAVRTATVTIDFIDTATWTRKSETRVLSIARNTTIASMAVASQSRSSTNTMFAMDNAVLSNTYEDEGETEANYTVSYQTADGTVVKTVEATGTSGNIANIDTSVIDNELGRFYYVRDNSKTVTIAEGAVITVTVRAAEVYNVSAVAVYDDTQVAIKSAAVTEGDTFTYTYSKYLTDENDNVVATCGTNSYSKTVTPTEDGAVYTVAYTAYDGNPIKFKEHENIYKYNNSQVLNSANYSGNAATRAAESGRTAFTVPEDGIYTIIVAGSGRTTTAESSFTVSKNAYSQTTVETVVDEETGEESEVTTTSVIEENVLFSGDMKNSSQNTTQTNGTKTLEGVELAGGDVIIIQGSNGNTWLDYVELIETVSLVPTATPEPTEEPTEEPTAAPTEEPTEEPTQEPTAAPTEAPTAAPTEEPGAGIPTITLGSNGKTVTFNQNSAQSISMVLYINAGDDAEYEYTSGSGFIAKGQAARDNSGNLLNPSAGYDTWDVSAHPSMDLGKAGYYTFRISYVGEDGVSATEAVKIYVENSTAMELIQGSDSNNLTIAYNGNYKLNSIYYINTGDDDYDYTSWSKFVTTGQSYKDENGMLYNPTCGYFVSRSRDNGFTEIVERPGHHTAIIQYVDTQNVVHLVQQKFVVDEYSIPQLVQSEEGSPYFTIDYNKAASVSAVYLVNVGDNSDYHYTSYNDYEATGKAAKDGLNLLNPTAGYDYFRSTADGDSYVVETEGYYVARIKYTDANGGTYYANQNLNVTKTFSPELIVDASTGLVTVQMNEAESMRYVLYAHLGQNADSYKYNSTNTFVQYGQVARDDNWNKLNPSAGYRALMNPTDGTSVKMPYAGTYAAILDYIDAAGNSFYHHKSFIYTIDTVE